VELGEAVIAVITAEEGDFPPTELYAVAGILTVRAGSNAGSVPGSHVWRAGVRTKMRKVRSSASFQRHLLSPGECTVSFLRQDGPLQEMLPSR